MNSWTERLRRCMFPAESGAWLAYLRVGLGVVIASYCLSLRSDWNDLFGASDQGAITRSLAEKILSIDSPLIPRLGWITALGTRFGLTDETIVWIAWLGLFCAGCALLLGILPRFFAVLAWFLHLSVAKTGEFVSYGVENFMTIGLFYLMLAPQSAQFSLTGRWWHAREHRASLAGFYRRLLQVHLCVIYFFGGITKALGSGWWDGSNMWRALTRIPFNLLPAEVVARWKYFLPIAGISVCILEAGYPIFIWLKRTRTIWLALVLMMHALIGLLMGMYLFAFVMIVLNLAGFAPDAILAIRLKSRDTAAGKA